MCGLTAYIGKEKISKLELDFLMLSNLKRGKDSAGYYNGDTNKISKQLNDVDENLLLDNPIEPTSLFLGHCRASTAHYTTKDVNSAHPFCFKGVVFMHNGTIDNLYDLKTFKPYSCVEDPTCEVDSKYIAWRISADGEPFTILKTYGGKATFVWTKLILNKKKQVEKTLCFYHDEHRPLFSGIHPKTGGLLLHSLENSLKIIDALDVKEVPKHTLFMTDTIGNVIDSHIIVRAPYVKTTHRGTVHYSSAVELYHNTDNTINKYIDKAKNYLNTDTSTQNVDTSLKTEAKIYKSKVIDFQKQLKDIEPSSAAGKILCSVDYILNGYINKEPISFIKESVIRKEENKQHKLCSFQTNYTDFIDYKTVKNVKKEVQNLIGDVFKDLPEKEKDPAYEWNREFYDECTYFSIDAAITDLIWVTEKEMAKRDTLTSINMKRIFRTVSPPYTCGKNTTRYIDIQELHTNKILRRVNIAALCFYTNITNEVLEVLNKNQHIDKLAKEVRDFNGIMISTTDRLAVSTDSLFNYISEYGVLPNLIRDSKHESIEKFGIKEGDIDLSAFNQHTIFEMSQIIPIIFNKSLHHSENGKFKEDAAFSQSNASTLKADEVGLSVTYSENHVRYNTYIPIKANKTFWIYGVGHVNKINSITFNSLALIAFILGVDNPEYLKIRKYLKEIPAHWDERVKVYIKKFKATEGTEATNSDSTTDMEILGDTTEFEAKATEIDENLADVIQDLRDHYTYVQDLNNGSMNVSVFSTQMTVQKAIELEETLKDTRDKFKTFVEDVLDIIDEQEHEVLH